MRDKRTHCYGTRLATEQSRFFTFTLWTQHTTNDVFLLAKLTPHQLLAYADDVNILGGNIHTVKENAEALVVATKETGLEVNADKTKYVVMSREQTAGLRRTMKVDNSSIERVEEFKYLGTTLTNQNSI